MKTTPPLKKGQYVLCSGDPRMLGGHWHNPGEAITVEAATVLKAPSLPHQGHMLHQPAVGLEICELGQIF